MQKVKKVLPFIAAGLALLAVIFLALPAAKYEEWGWTMSANGFTAIFGGNMIEMDEGVKESYAYFGFSFINFLAFLCLIVAAVLEIVATLTKKNVFGFIASGLFVVAGILFFCMLRNFAFDKSAEVFYGYTEAEFAVEKNFVLQMAKLGAGAILPAVCSILAAIVVLVECFFDKLFKQAN